MTEDSFQITLPSNSSRQFFPDNRANSYKTKLLRPIALPGTVQDWEVALLDIQYPHNWPNVLESTSLGLIIVPHGELLWEKGWASSRDYRKLYTPGSDKAFETALNEALANEASFKLAATLHICRIEIRRGNYVSLWKLGKFISERMNAEIQPINHSPEKAKFSIDFSYDQISRRAAFSQKGPGDYFFVTNSRYLMESIFSFKPEVSGLESASAPSSVSLSPAVPPLPFPAAAAAATTAAAGAAAGASYMTYRLPQESTLESALEHLSSMFVYSNLAAYQLVGDTAAQLLAIIPLKAEEDESLVRGEEQYFALNPTHYVTLSKAEFEIIEIQLCTDWGDPFPFSTTAPGKVCCRLHFRKRAGNRSTTLFL